MLITYQAEKYKVHYPTTQVRTHLAGAYMWKRKNIIVQLADRTWNMQPVYSTLEEGQKRGNTKSKVKMEKGD